MDMDIDEGSLPVEAKASYVRPMPLAKGLLQACKQFKVDQTSVDGEALEIAKYVLNTNAQHRMISAVAQAEVLGIPWDKISSSQERLAASMVMLSKLLRCSWETSLCESLPACCLKLYVDAVAYDETPLTVAVKHSIADCMVCGEDAPESSQGLHSETTNPLPLTLPAPQVSEHAKIVQLKSCFGMLLHLGDRHCFFMGQNLQPLQAVASTSGSNMFAGLCRTEVVSLLANNFHLKVRSATLDKAKSNLSTERLVMAGRAAGWNELMQFCSSHVIATCCKKTCDSVTTLGSDVSAILKCSLSLREGSRMATFREALVETIYSRPILFIRGLSDSAKEHKRKLMEVLIQRKGTALQSLQAAVLLEQTMTGDWRNTESLEFLVTEGCRQPSEQQVKRTMASVLCH
eukprot:3689321-Amphidinium_carterae.1